MAGMFDVPTWIQPPSPAEQEAIDQATADAQRKAFSMIRRGIGMSRMNSETQQMVADGVDPITAKQNALLNNAHLLFADHPEQIDNMLEQRQANKIRENALLQAKHKQESDDTMDALKLKQQREIADQNLKENTRWHTGELDAKKALNAPFTPTVENVTNPETGEVYPTLRKSPRSVELLVGRAAPGAAAKEKRLEQKDVQGFNIQFQKLLAADPNHTALQDSVAAARAKRDAAEASFTETGGSKSILHPFAASKEKVAAAQADLDKAEGALKEYRAKARKQLTESDTTTTKAAAEPAAKLDLTPGKRYRNAEGEVKTLKSIDADGNPVWD